MSLLRKLALFACIVAAFGKPTNTSEDVFAAEIAEWEGRIIGGITARPSQFRHQVSFRRANGQHFCGGGILNNNFVLSAGHCFQGPTGNARNVRAAVGAYRRVNDGVVHNIAYIVVHPFFNIDLMQNDIALARTETPIQFNSRNVAPIQLPAFNTPANTGVTISGWGRTIHPGQPGQPNVLPNVLQFQTSNTISREDCVRQLRGRGRFVYPNTLCTTNPTGEGTCFGDSGGPLINSRNEVVGVVSWGVACARGVPDVYARVFSHLQWIRTTLAAPRPPSAL